MTARSILATLAAAVVLAPALVLAWLLDHEEMQAELPDDGAHCRVCADPDEVLAQMDVEMWTLEMQAPR